MGYVDIKTKHFKLQSDYGGYYFIAYPENKYAVIVGTGANKQSVEPGWSIMGVDFFEDGSPCIDGNVIEASDMFEGNPENWTKANMEPLFDDFEKQLKRNCSELSPSTIKELVKDVDTILSKTYWEADKKANEPIKDERELEFYVETYDDHASFYAVRPDRKFIKLTIDYISLAKRNGKLEVYKPDIHDYFASSKRVDIDRSIVASPNGFKSLIIERVNNEDSLYGSTFDEYKYASKAVKVDYKRFYEGVLNTSRFTEQQIKTIESEKEEVKDQIAYLQRYLADLDEMC